MPAPTCPDCSVPLRRRKDRTIVCPECRRTFKPRPRRRRERPDVDDANSSLAGLDLSDPSLQGEPVAAPEPPRRRSTRTSNSGPRQARKPQVRTTARRRGDGRAAIGQGLLIGTLGVSLLVELLGVYGGWEDGSWYGAGDLFRWGLLTTLYLKTFEGRNWARVCLGLLMGLSVLVIGGVGLVVIVAGASSQELLAEFEITAEQATMFGVVVLAMALLPAGQIVALCTPWVSAYMAQQRGE